MSLIAANPELIQDIKNCVKDAMFQAYMTSISEGSVEGEVAGKINSDAVEAGTKYAETLANIMSVGLTNAIYKYIKRIQIVITPTQIIDSMGFPVIGAADVEMVGGVNVE